MMPSPQIVEARMVVLRALVTERHPLDDAIAAFEGLVERCDLKIIVEPG